MLKMRVLIGICLVAVVQCQTRQGAVEHNQPGDTGEAYAGEAYVHNPVWDLTPFQLYKLRKQGINPESLNAPVENIIVDAAPEAPAAVPQKRVKAVRRPVAGGAPVVRRPAAEGSPAVRRPAAGGAPAVNHPKFQNFKPSNTRQPARQSAVPRPQAVQAVPRPQAVQAVPRPQAVQAVSRPQAVQAIPRPQAVQAIQRSEAVPAVQAAPAAAKVPAPAFQSTSDADQTADFIAEATRHPDPNFWSRAYAYAAPTYAAKAEGSSYTYEAIF